MTMTRKMQAEKEEVEEAKWQSQSQRRVRGIRRCTIGGTSARLRQCVWRKQHGKYRHGDTQHQHARRRASVSASVFSATEFMRARPCRNTSP